MEKNKFNENPFSLMFGKSPSSIIKREDEYQKIIHTFNNFNPSTYAYIITGVRGSGKTVMLREIAEEYSNLNDWIVLDINSQGDIINDLAEKFFNEGQKNKLFNDWSITINAKIFTLQFGKKETTSNPEIIFEKLLKKANDQGKRVLITIDEITSSTKIKKFANFYQSMIGKDYKLFLLMTGLKNNINVLINSKSSSFLSRTLKIELKPLNEIEIATEYEKLLNVSFSFAASLAKLTSGYAFAYQVLGYLFYENKCKEINDDLLEKYDSYLVSNRYAVIFKDLTDQEKNFCMFINDSESKEVNEIMKISNLKESNFQRIRRDLIEKDIIKSVGYGKLDFVLPRFNKFLSMMKYFE